MPFVSPARAAECIDLLSQKIPILQPDIMRGGFTQLRVIPEHAARAGMTIAPLSNYADIIAPSDISNVDAAITLHIINFGQFIEKLLKILSLSLS